MVSTDDVLSDMEFGISNQESIVKLIRKSEMYQREEKSRTETRENIWWSQDEITTYDYYKVWSENVIDSSKFYEREWHVNPPIMQVEPKTQQVRNAKLWAFNLSSEQIGKMNWSEELDYKEERLGYIADKYKMFAEVVWNKIYIGKANKADPSNPQIWDIRIGWSIVPVDTVSIIAEQNSQTFRPYQTKAWNAISMISRWNKSAENMILEAEKANSLKTWLIRLLWVILIFIWFNLILSILPTLGSVLPIFGRIVWAWVSLVSFVLWLSLWILTIAISRLRFRPVTSIVLIIISVWLLFWIRFYKKNNKKAEKN